MVNFAFIVFDAAIVAEASHMLLRLMTCVGHAVSVTLYFMIWIWEVEGQEVATYGCSVYIRTKKQVSAKMLALKAK
jgi:hypothetical protein